MSSDGRACFRRVPSGFVLAMQDGRLASADWDRFVTLVRERRIDTPPLCLTRSQGAYPDAAQRRALMEAIGPALQPHARIAVLTDSVVGRAAVTAMAWITPGFRPFRPHDTAGALHYLGVTGAPTADMERVLVELEAELGVRVNAS
jgi:hypothetical protein